MENQIIMIYCLCDDYIQSIGHRDWPNVKLCSAEILLVVITSMRFFHGNMSRALSFLVDCRFLRTSFSTSALNRRIYKIPEFWWNGILKFIQKWGRIAGLPLEYIVDAFPVSVCRNIRISRCHVYRSEEFRGYNVSKKEYFYGVKATVITTVEGYPVQAILCPGKEHDSVPFKFMDVDLPEGSRLYGDSAYLDYENEEKLRREKGIKLVAERKSNSTKPLALEDFVGLKYLRGGIERAFGQLSKFFPRTIHTRTPEGFELKIMAFIVAFATTFVSS
jgi:hypothetical protein